MLIEWVGANQDDVYIDACIENSLYQNVGRDLLNIVFTSIHGTTYTTVPKALAKAGFTSRHGYGTNDSKRKLPNGRISKS